MGTEGVSSKSVVSLLAAALVGCSSPPKKQPEPPVESPKPAVVSAPEPTPTPAAAEPTPAPAAPSGPVVGDLRKVGKIDFQTSCQGVQADFERAMALLHSFFYQEARRRFTLLTDKDPQCAIAHWGVAMTWYHPIWAPPTPEEMASGKAALEKARKATKVSPREKGFIDALGAFYDDMPMAAAKPADTTGGKTGMSCHGPTGGGTHPERATAWAKAMEKLSAANPDDVEAATFYALSLLGSAKPVDPTFENPLKSAAILEKLWPTHRDHPGIAHYLIHSYDYPKLAAKGLEAARAYADIAPWVPHVLHMPSHIFVRLGMWTDNVTSNMQSAEAARAYATEQKMDGMLFEELHANDYLVYGYLQLGMDSKAKEVVDHVTSAKKTVPAIDFVASYAVGAIPARFAVERHAWAEAAALQVPEATFWSKFPFTEAHIEYARGLGRARTGDVAGAKKSLARLAELRDLTNDPKFAYFKSHLALQHQAIAAWVADAEGKTADAIKQLRAAAKTEDELGKSPVSPGPINIIYEQLGDMLMLRGKTKDAIVAYETALKSSPGRLNSLLGAGMAAEKAKNAKLARKYFEQAVEQTKDGDSQRPELVHAREVVAKK